MTRVKGVKMTVYQRMRRVMDTRRIRWQMVVRLG